jgi:hypothetical protein
MSPVRVLVDLALKTGIDPALDAGVEPGVDRPLLARAACVAELGRRDLPVRKREPDAIVVVVPHHHAGGRDPGFGEHSCDGEGACTVVGRIRQLQAELIVEPGAQ